MSNTVKVSKLLWRFADSIQHQVVGGQDLCESSRTIQYRNDYKEYDYIESDIDKLLKYCEDNLIRNAGERYVTYFSNGAWTTPISIEITEIKQIILHPLKQV